MEEEDERGPTSDVGGDDIVGRWDLWLFCVAFLCAHAPPYLSPPPSEPH